MAATTKFETVGVFQNFQEFASGPAKGNLKQIDGTILEVKLWPTLKDFREDPPLEEANPAYIAAQASEGGKWFGYSKLEEYNNQAARVWYLTGHVPEEWTTEDNEPIADVVTITPPNGHVTQPPATANGKISSYSLGSAARIVSALCQSGVLKTVEEAKGVWFTLAEDAEELVR